MKPLGILPLRPGAALMQKLPLPAQLGLLFSLAVAGFALAAFGPLGAALGVLAAFSYATLSFGIVMHHGLTVIRQNLEAMCQGDLTREPQIDGGGELAAIGGHVRTLARQLSQVLASIRSESQLVAMAGDDMGADARELSTRTESQASSLEETNASLAELLQTVRRNSERTHAADTLAAQVSADAESGRTLVEQSVSSMQRIEQRSREMGEILSVIDGIAFQTNILALNAAVEAARAGEAGRGFAVVASEVRALAQRSAQAASEVKQLIQRSNDEVAGGVQCIHGASGSLAKAVEGVRSVAEQLRGLTGSNSEQNNSLEEIAQAVRGMDDITQRNAQMVDLSAQACERLRAQAANLSRSVIAMRLRQGCADEARTLVERAAKLVDTLGAEEAVKRFHDPKGGFIDRDLYIVAVDRDDYFRAFGADPAKANRRRRDAIPGVEKNTTLSSDTWRAVEKGGGWVEFNALHPPTKLPVEKIAYVVPALGGRWAMQCSVNRSEARSAAQATSHA